MTTHAAWTEILCALRYDWNQDGSKIQGCSFVADGECLPEVGQQVVLYDDGLAVVTHVTKRFRSSTRDGWMVKTVYATQASGSIKAVPA